MKERRSAPSCHRWRRQFAQNGFSLVELLVVIGIISLLAAMLLPALGLSRERGKTIACLNNLKQIGTALVMYEDDNDGYLVPAEYDPANGAMTKDGWPSILVLKGYLPALLAPGKTQVNSSASVFKCPSGVDDVTSDAATVTSRSDPNGAKAYPYAVGNTTSYIDCWYGINAATGTNSVSNYPFSRVPLDGGTTVLHKANSADPVAARMPAVYDGWWLHNGYDQRINARHMRGTRTNILFFDGHAATYDTFAISGVQDANANDPRWMY